MTILVKRFFGLAILMNLISFGYVFAEGMDVSGGHDMSSMEGGTNMVPFHLAEIFVALAVLVLVSRVITATGQASVFIYIPIAMVFFVIRSIVGYSPHLGMMSSSEAMVGSTILGTVAILLLGVSFYKWKKMLG